MAVTWGSTVGSYGRIGINVTTSSTATTTSVSATVYFWSKYTVSDTTNTLYFNYGATSATTSQGSKSIKTTSNSGSGWSTTNQIAIGTYTASYARGTSAKTVYCAAKLSGVDVVGGTMTHYVAFTVPALDSYAVTYNANGGTGAPSNQTKWYGTNITLSSSEPTRTGYTFKGWATSSSGSVAYSPGASYTANAAVTLYAVWQIITYKVTYNANGGTGAPTAQTKNHGTALTLSTGKPTRANYNFLGWSASATGTVAYAPGASYTANAAVTLYAVWELAYYVPSITNTTIYRCTADGTLSETGTYYYLKFDWECCQLLGNNPVQSATVYRSVNIPPMTGGSSLNVGTTATSGTYVPINALGAGGCDPDKMYYVRICVTDSMGGVGTKVLILNKAKFIIDIKAGGDGISFGGPAARAGADFFMDAFFNKKIYDDYGRRINNGLAVYEAGGQTDPNTTLDELILTEKGTPAAGMFFYIQTYFLLKNRQQRQGRRQQFHTTKTVRCITDIISMVLGRRGEDI